jgi:hypothetical protein
MTSLFDGLGTLTSAIFGATVSVEPIGQPARDIQAIFREAPMRVLTQDGGEMVTVLPTLRGVKSVLSVLSEGATVDPGNGKTYRCVADITTGSPAADGHVIWQLELTGAS